ncbi:immunoglobulin domain-containing protein [uncultured Eubacterium sp.]|uniref:immunoglobulin domain-containing protein n=1 Tax=uncultured Eubacterium sp. TaxID=165185 RepID=UPI002673505C|nr:immunoglobulin domain-containing protein [uncultured Eubacterium sp.]
MKMGEKLKKVIAFVMSVAIVICMCPLSHEIYAEGNDDNFKIQVLQKEIPMADIECYLTNNDEGNLLSDTGMTDSDGIWVTKYSLEELDGTEMELTIDGKKRTVTFNSESRQYLLVELSNFEQTRWEEKAVETEILESIDGLESLIVDNGTKIEVLKDKLPVSVHINTSTKKHDVAQVEWDYSTIKYDVNCKSEEQKFNVSGKVKIPEGVKVSEESLLDVILHITVKKYPDAEFTIEPKDVVLNVGDELNLSASAKNADENTYRWYRDGQEVTGAVGQSIHIDNVSLKDSGIYTCKVMGLNGTEVETREVKVSINKILSDNMMLAMKDSASTTQTRPIEKVGIQVINLNQDATGTLTYTVRVKSDNSIIAELTKDAGTGREYIFEIPKTAVNDYVFSVKYSGDEKYEGAESSLEFHMEKGMQSKLELGIPESIKLADKSSELPNLEVSGGDGSGNYIYSIGEEYDIVGNKLEGTNNIAEINKDGTGLTIKRSGKFQIVIYREGDNDYNESKPVSVAIEVGKKQQSGFRFEKEPETLIYENGLTYTNKVVGIESSNQEVEYEIVEGKDVADIQDETLKIKKAGTVTVRAIHSGDDIYAAAEAEYKITIERAKQQVQFENVASNKIKYGTISYKNKAFSSQTDSKGEVSYIIISGEDIAEINQNSGELTFKDGKTGMVVVKASIAKCERYEEAASEYCVEVEENICPENAYIIEGESKNGWYRSDITIKPKVGYLIGKSNALNADFSDKIVVENEGKNNGFDIYLKDKEDGSITLGTTIDSSNLKIDKTGPENLMINYEEPKGTFWENITYGYYQSTVTVTISATDSLSGIESMHWEYHSNDTEHITKLEATEGELDKKSLTYSEDGTEASAEITLRVESVEDLKGNIIIKACDCAGHDTTTEDSGYVVVFDNISPTTSVSYSQAERVVDVETLEDVKEYDYGSESKYNLYYKEKATATITVDEKNFYPDGIEVRVKNVRANQEYKVSKSELNWYQKEDTKKWIGVININEDGEYVISMSGTDYSSNKMTEYTSPNIIINKQKPKIEVEYDNKEVENEKYYKKSRTATITIKDRDFRADDVEAVVVAEDVAGQKVSPSFIVKDKDGKDVIVSDYNAYLKERENWSGNQTEHTATVTFDTDAQYYFSIAYTNLAGKEADTYSDEFVVDKTEPDSMNIHVSYSESLLDKLIKGITFGYYNPDVTVRITAEDDTSGIDYINWYYEKENGASSINVEKEDKTINNTDEKFSCSSDKKTASVEFTLTADEAKQYRGKISAEATDKAGNCSQTYHDNAHVVVVDTIAPTRTVSYSQADRVVDADTLKDVEAYDYSSEGRYKLYYKEEATATITVDEANFYPEDVHITVKNVETEEERVVKSNELDWEQIADTDKWIGNIKIEENGDYLILMTYSDRSTNEMKEYLSPYIMIDDNKPKISVVYDNNEAVNGKYYAQARTAKITVEEHNFRAEDVETLVLAKDVARKDVGVKDYAAYLKDRESWVSEGDIHTATVTFDADAQYDFVINYSDLRGNPADTYDADMEDTELDNGEVSLKNVSAFVIDKTAPDSKNIHVSYSKSLLDKLIEGITFGYYNPDVTVRITAEDDISGIDNIHWYYEKEDGASSINVDKEDKTINNTDEKFSYSSDNKTASVEFTLPAEEAEQYRGKISAEATDKAGNLSETYHDNAHVVVVDTIAPTRTVSYSQADRVVDADTLKDVEAYDYSSEGRYKLYYKEEATATITVDEANFYPEDVHITVKNVETEEERVVKSNELDWEQIADTDKWIGNIKIEENGDYLILMTYSDRSTNEMKEYLSPYIMIDDNKPKISVVYDNNEAVNGKYYAQARTAKITVEEHNFRAEDVETLVLAKDVARKDVGVKDYAAYLKDRESWVSEGDIHTATVTFDADAQYDFVINYSDLRGNPADTYDADMEDTELLDNGEVSPDNVSAFVIDKTAPAKEEIRVSYSESLLDKFLEGITFGYYNPSVTVKITAEDDTSGIDYISWYYEKESEVSSSNREKENGTIKNTDDKFTNSYDKKISSVEFTLTADEAKQYRGKISAVVTDKAGNHSDEYKDSHRVVVVDTISPTRTVSFSNAEHVVNAKTLKTVDKYNYSTEGNKYKLYYQSQAIVTFSVNEANFYPEDVEIKINGQKVRAEKWKKWKDDNWTSSITIAKEGHYVVTMDYKDRSNNKMKSYTSNEIIIDKTRPAIDVEYSEDNVIRTVKGRKYYDKKQTAMITITEHNFRADDVEVVVKAKDITGNDIKVMDFAKYLKNRGNWKSNGDVHTAKIAYTKNANYTFDVKYKDLSNRNILRYKSDKFTVDKTNPANLKVSYSTNIFENVLNSVTFGFYNAQMTVTIQADDNISGIHKFVYSYENAKGVSKRNAELIDKALTNARITYINGGKTAVAKFNIPKNTLKGDNQFRGKVRFTAYDRSDNSSDKEEKKTVVVDNIAPQGNVTLNKPVASNNGISYYTGNITATIQINEANFYPEDVSIKVNGASRRAEKWTQNGDNWTGIVTISGDGHYKLNVDYKDRSQNKMKSYQSNELTIDSRKPTIMVQGIKNNSANKKDKIGFTIVSKDENLNSGAFDAELSAVYKTGDGKFKTKIIDIGKGVLSDKGKTHSYVIDNLKEDAVYTLKCKAADYAGNSIDTFTISDSGNEQSKNLSFSVNRKGSAFMLDDYAKQIVDNYYNQSVDGDIKIVEINVDPLRSYKVELNNRELREGIDYTVSKSEGKGKWCRYEYSIKSSLFQEENNYSVIVTSTDKTKTVAYSDIKKAEISFVIDKTSPVLTVSGMEKNGRYQTDSQTVTIIPTDDGGKLSSVIVEVTDRDGNIINTPFDLTGDSLENTLEKDSNKLIFHLKEGMYQNVIITCKDKAGNSYSSKEIFYNITVSPSAFVIFWTNTLLRWVVIIGLVLIVSGILWIILRKRKAKATTK